MDPATGALTPRDVVRTTANPSWLALDRTRTHLYSANEVAAAETGAGTVSAYSIDRPTGRLTLLNTVSSEGAGPAHMSIHPAGKHALVANYGGGTVAVLPIQPDGRLGAASDVKRHQGTTGPARASSAPPGSFAISGHDRPHAHMIESDASGRFVFAADLGLDQILVWRFDDAKGTLTPNDPPSVALPPGDGPRHFAFHPKGRWFYSLQEEASTVVTFDYDAANGRLSAKQTISTLPRGFAGTNFTSGIVVSPDARFVYVANRLHDSIAWLSIGERWHADLGGGGVDPRRLSPELHDRSDRTVPVLVQSAFGRDRVFPGRCEVGRPDVHRAVHAGRALQRTSSSSADPDQSRDSGCQKPYRRSGGQEIEESIAFS